MDNLTSALIGFTSSIIGMFTCIIFKFELEQLREKRGEIKQLKKTAGEFKFEFMSWQTLEHKSNFYNEKVTEFDSVIGKLAEYGNVPIYADYVRHYCSLLTMEDNTPKERDELKEELEKHYKNFLNECGREESYLENIKAIFKKIYVKKT